MLLLLLLVPPRLLGASFVFALLTPPPLLTRRVVRTPLAEPINLAGRLAALLCLLTASAPADHVPRFRALLAVLIGALWFEGARGSGWAPCQQLENGLVCWMMIESTRSDGWTRMNQAFGRPTLPTQSTQQPS